MDFGGFIIVGFLAFIAIAGLWGLFSFGLKAVVQMVIGLLVVTGWCFLTFDPTANDSEKQGAMIVATGIFVGAMYLTALVQSRIHFWRLSRREGTIGAKANGAVRKPYSAG